MSTTWASKISMTVSPTRSYIAWMSSRRARPSWTRLTIDSSAARSSASASSRRVSAISRAFSRATVRLAARVVSRRTSPSLNASVRSRFWREMPPRTSPPTIIGTRTIDRDGSPWTIGIESPRARSQAGTSGMTRGARAAMNSSVVSVNGVGSSG